MTKCVDVIERSDFFLGGSRSAIHQPTSERMEFVERVERRQYARYCLGAPVSFTWKDRDGVRQWGEGFTRDVCARGAFVLTEANPAAETVVRIVMTFHSLDGVSAMHMRVDGRVVRVEPDLDNQNRCGFAVLGKATVLRNNKQD